MFEVKVDGAVRSSIEVAQTESAWQADRLGAPNLIATLSGAVPEGATLVHVPAMNLYLVARKAPDGGLELWSVLDAPDLELVAGEPHPAAELLLDLKARAPADDGIR